MQCLWQVCWSVDYHYRVVSFWCRFDAVAAVACSAFHHRHQHHRCRCYDRLSSICVDKVPLLPLILCIDEESRWINCLSRRLLFVTLPACLTTLYTAHLRYLFSHLHPAYTFNNNINSNNCCSSPHQLSCAVRGENRKTANR